jgi:Tol biopolymer transport system component
VDAKDNTSLIALDIKTGRQRTIFVSPLYLNGPSISPDGKRIAVSGGMLEWNIVEIDISGAKVNPVLLRGGTSYFPDWAPDATHYALATNSQGTSGIEDRPLKGGFARRMISLTTEGLDEGTEWFSQPRWAPDGERFAFTSAGPTGNKVWVSSASGARPVAVDPTADQSAMPTWSPDGQWLAYFRQKGSHSELVKVQPGSETSMSVLTASHPGFDRLYTTIQWSPSGDSILYPSNEGLALVAADNQSERALSTRKFAAYGFSKDGRSVIGVLRGTSPDSPEWQLLSVNVSTGVETILGPLDLPPTTNAVAGFSMHPSGTRFASSISKLPYDIWMLEGFDEQKSWFDRLRGR